MTPKEEAKAKVVALVAQFSSQIEEYKKKDYNEATNRNQYIDPFFEALGWDISNATGKLETERDVKLEVKQVVDDQTKRPDYCFTKGGKAKFYLEAKKPSIVVKDDAPSAKQVRRYTWSAKLPVAVLTDFEELAIYDGAYKVKEDDSASVARLKYLKFTEYEKEFDFLWDTLSREAVWNRSLERFAKVGTTKKGSQSVDDDFLASLNQWRNYLATGIVAGNPSLDEEQINVVVQTVLDRIIFLRISEDRNVEKYGKLRECAKLKGETYTHLYQYFIEADQKYNSGLFDIKKDVLTKDLKITNKILKTLIAELYHPKTPYEFSVMPVEILGNAYEQFLGKIIKITKVKSVTIEEKPAVRKAGGVYYTPEYIVEYIVQNTIGKKIAEIEQTAKITEVEKEVAKLRIVDPSCGSGSFLLGAYQFLLDWHLNYYAKYPQTTKTKKEQPLTSEGKLTSTVKKRILLNNIFGVDIDINAVEVTKLSLLLKAMEGETEVTIQNALQLFNERVLPTLDNNIQSGNSLIDVDIYGNALDLDIQVEKKIKPFNWKSSFPTVFSATSQGFDVVIGNPPYVTIGGKEDTMFIKEEPEYLLAHYISNQYKPNLYAFFYEKAYKILKPQGVVSFIVPRTFAENMYYAPIRNFFANNSSIQELMRLDYEVFKDVTTGGTTICRFEKNMTQNPTIQIKIVSEKDKFQEPFVFLQDQKNALTGEQETFNFQNPQIALLFQHIGNVGTSLEIFCTVNNGVNTGNAADILLSKSQKSSKHLMILEGKDITRYKVSWGGNWINYDANLKNTIDLKDLKTKQNKIDFALRDSKIFSNPKIIIRQTADKIVASYDDKGYITRHSTHCINSIGTSINLKYLLGVLNSKLMKFYYQTFIPEKGKAFAEVKAIYVKQLPIKNIDVNNPQEVALQNEIIQCVDLLSMLYERLDTKLSDFHLKQTKQRIDYNEDKINDLVLDLYGITNPTEREIILQS